MPRLHFGLKKVDSQSSGPAAVALVLLFLKRTPRALNCAPNNRQHLCKVCHEASEWGQRRIGGNLPEEIEVQASL